MAVHTVLVAYVYIHLLVEAVAQQEAVGHAQTVRLHRMSGAVIIRAIISCKTATQLDISGCRIDNDDDETASDLQS